MSDERPTAHLESGAQQRAANLALLATAGTRLLALGSLFVAVFAVYWSILRTFFALDDFTWLLAAQDPDAAGFMRGAFTENATPFWRPMVDAYFYAEWRVFGFEATGYHVSNVLIHGMNASLLAILGWQLSRSLLTGFAAGLLFAVLPTYDIAVSWVSSVTELLAVFFYLLSLVLYIAHRRGMSWPLMYVASIVALLFALLTKESAVSEPLVILGVALFVDMPRSRRDAIELVKDITPFALLGLAYFVFRYVESYGNVSDNGLYRFGWHGFQNFWDYVQWMALPLRDGEYAWAENARPVAGALFLASGVLAVVFRWRLPALAFLWMVAAITSYVFFLGGTYLRYTYMAAAPFSLFVVSMAATLGQLVIAKAKTNGYATTVARGAGVAVILLVAAFMAREAHDMQERLAGFARDYRELYVQVTALCGDVPPQGHVFVMDSPIFDYYGGNTRSLVNVAYDEVNVFKGVSPLPPWAATVENKCVVSYDKGSKRYVRTQ